MKKEDFKNDRFRKNLTDAQKTIVDSLTDEQYAAIGAVAESKINTATGEVMGNFDRQIETITGVKKEGSQKSTEYMKVAFEQKLSSTSSEITTLKGNVQALTTQRDEFKAQIDAGGGDEALKKQIASLDENLIKAKGKIETLTSEHNQVITQKDQSFKDFKINSGIISSIPNFKADQDPKYIEYLKNDMITKVLGEFDVSLDDKDNLVFEKDMQKQNIQDYFKSNYSEYLAIGKSGGGAGSGGAGGGGTGDLAVDLTAAKDYMEGFTMLEKALTEKGLEEGSEDYQKEWDKHSDGLSKLPMDASLEA